MAQPYGMGIAPMQPKPPLAAPQQTPPIMDPQMKPAAQPAAVPSSAARDVAIRNLGTQTAAAPTTSVPPNPASATPATALPADPSAAAPPTEQTHLPRQGFVRRAEAWLQSNPDAQPLVDAIHNAATPQDRMTAIHALMDQYGHGIGMERGRGPQMEPDTSDYSNEYDRLEAQDAAAAPAEQAAPTGGDEAARREAFRIKKMRQNRLGG